MLKEMEAKTYERECTGRGQLLIDWQGIVRKAANTLRRIPYYGNLLDLYQKPKYLKL